MPPWSPAARVAVISRETRAYGRNAALPGRFLKNGKIIRPAPPERLRHAAVSEKTLRIGTFSAMAEAAVVIDHAKARMQISPGLKLSREIPTSAEGPRLCTLSDALRLIDRNLPKDRRHFPHWRRARELLTKALRSKDPEVIAEATDHLERALRVERGRG
jgi:hypothetical protein